MNQEIPCCDVCGKPATSWAIDTIRHEYPGAQWVEWSPTTIKHYGCADHPAQSEEHLTQLPRQA